MFRNKSRLPSAEARRNKTVFGRPLSFESSIRGRLSSPPALFVAWAVFQLAGCLSFPSDAMLASKIGTGPATDGGISRSTKSDMAELPPKQGAEACIATAQQLQANGHGKEAITLYERARKLDPRNRQISRYLAVLYDQEGNDSRAMAEYHKALDLTPHDADLLNDVGYYYFRRHEWGQAEDYFRKAIAQTPEHERALVNLGLALGEQERYQESFDTFSKVLGPAAAHSNVGVILAAHQHRAEAIAAFRKALAIKTDMPQARAFLAHLEKEDLPAGPQTPFAAQTSQSRN
jgi:Tfp pilus assembly protein PilF